VREQEGKRIPHDLKFLDKFTNAFFLLMLCSPFEGLDGHDGVPVKSLVHLPTAAFSYFAFEL
jgi:hypothetical protein